MIFKKLGLFILLLVISFNVFAQETLIFAFDVIRHGDRTSLHTIPKVPYVWPQGLGQLTAEGMQQEFQLGVEFRKKYINHFHLLATHFNNKEIYIFSTDADRTLMSAESVLFGLYPLGTGPFLFESNKPALPYHYQPIPIHIKSKDGSDIPDDDGSEYRKRLKKYVFNRPDWIQKTAALKPEFARWSQATGLKLTTIRQLCQLADTLYIYQLHHVPMPAGLSAEDVKRIIAIGTEGLLTEYQTKEIADIVGSPLLLTITNYLKRASTQKTPLKYVLFSAHDSTIMSLMTTLKSPLNTKPPYGANLNFSLFKTGSSDYLVKITYNGKPVMFKGCHAEGCSLPQFIKQVMLC